jgi:hypothetical protein
MNPRGPATKRIVPKKAQPSQAASARAQQAGESKPPKKMLGQRLIEMGAIDEIQLSVALGMQKQTGIKIGQQLMKLGFIDEKQLTEALKDELEHQMPLIKRNITPQTIKSVPEEMAFQYKVMPVAFAGKTLILAVSDPNDIGVIDDLSFRLGLTIKPIKAFEWDIENALLKYYKFFSDEELEMLTNASDVARQYENTQWTFDHEKDASTLMGSISVDSITDMFESFDHDGLKAEGEAPDDDAPMVVNMQEMLTSHMSTDLGDGFKLAEAKTAAPAAKPMPKPATQAPPRPAPQAAPKPTPPAQPAPPAPAAPQAARPAHTVPAAEATPSQNEIFISKAAVELLIEKNIFTKNEFLQRLSRVKERARATRPKQKP